MAKQYSLVSLGEALWDVFPDGPRFGGAPANVACHAAALGADAYLVSRVGDDELGRQAIAALEEHGVNTDGVAVDPDHPTGTVQVKLDAAGKPQFTIGANAAWDHLAWDDRLDALAADCDAVCFGTLGQREASSRSVIRRFVAATRGDALRVVDVNLRPPFHDNEVIQESLRLANVLKLSDEELPIVAAAGGVDGTETQMLDGLIRQHDLQWIAVSRGSRGATLVGRDGRSDVEGMSIEVKDTVGAGDAFTAAMVLGLLQNQPLDAINRHACRVAAFVCTQSGATPPLPGELRNRP